MTTTPPQDSTQGGGQRREEVESIFFSRSLVLRDLRLIHRRLTQCTTGNPLVVYTTDVDLVSFLVETLITRYERIL